MTADSMPSLHVVYGQPDHLSTSYQTQQLSRALRAHFSVSEKRFADRHTGRVRAQGARIWSNLVAPELRQPNTDFILYGNDGLANIRRWRARKVIYWYDAPWDWVKTPPAWTQLRHRLRCDNIIFSDYVFAVSHKQVELARTLRLGREKTVVYLPVGVDCQTFQPSNDLSAIRARYRIPAKLIVGYVGYLARVGEHFAGERILEAAAELVKNHVVHFLIVGFGPAQGRFQQRVRGRGLSEHFTFTGYVPTADVPPLIAAMDICIDTLEPGFHSEARSETKLKQYMAMGRACVATAIGENCVDLEHGRCGVLVEPSDSGLRDGIARLLRDSAERARLGAAARRRAVEVYDWRVLARRFADTVLSH